MVYWARQPVRRYHAVMSDLGEEAERSARAAAARVGVEIVALADVSRQRAAVKLLDRVWRADPANSVVGQAVMRAYEFSGNYVVGAFRESQLVGAAVGFLGDEHLHSDVVGVASGHQGAGVGFALKQHQRAWALNRGLAEVRWTFDPLIRRNAHFNLRRLGASAARYMPDFYGPMDDGINAGDATDRIYIRWRLESERAVAAASGGLPPVDPVALRDAQVIVELDGSARPPHRLSGPSASSEKNIRLVGVPPDIERLRVSDPASGARWRHTVREALCAAEADGYTIADFSPDGYYVLTAHDRL